MSRCFLTLLVAMACAGACAAQTLETRPAQPNSAPVAPRALANNEPTYLKLRNIKLGTETVHVNNFTMKREAGTFTFKSGAFQFVEPVNGKITGAVFIGDGSFALAPPIELERRNLAILTKEQPFEEQFSTVVLRFTDGSEEEIRKGGTADNIPGGGDAAGQFEDIQHQLKKNLKHNLTARLLQDVMSGHAGSKFIAFIKGKKYSDKIVYDIDPHGAMGVSPEEVSLLLWDEGHEGIWASFHLLAEYKNRTANSDENNRNVSVQRQRLDTSIAKNAHLTGTAETSFVALEDGVRVVPFELFPTLRVDSVTSADGALSFIQEDKNEDSNFAVILPRELKKGESYTITTKYGGKDAISNEGGGNYYPIARSNWYPGQGFGSYATYDMTFRVPKGMTMVATGKLLKKIDEGNETVTEWTSEFPQAVAGFNFGNFKREEGKPFKQPYLLETFANPNPPDIVTGLQHIDDAPTLGGSHLSAAGTLGTMNTLSLMKKAMGEAQLSVEIYTDFFGEAPYKRLAMTQQTATNYGQSWPGLVYLPITYFFDTTVRHQIGMEDAHGYFKVVGPHEIAHQWWGHMVGFNSYRDQWMSEGFSDMSASLFLQYIYGQKNLDDYHKFWADERQILTDRNKEGKRAIDVGPVTLGYRLNNAKTGFDIGRRLLYPKGAYILQMIRFMMTQRSGDPDGPFKAMMHEFTKTYENRQASTEDFKAMVEKYMTKEMDIDKNHTMDWFFSEYVYGTEYPAYKFEHSFSNDANGDMMLNFKVTQSGVSKDFVMLVPLYLDLGGGRVARLGSATLSGNTSVEGHVPLKGLNEKPKRAMLAYYDDVLGSIENR